MDGHDHKVLEVVQTLMSLYNYGRNKDEQKKKTSLLVEFKSKYQM